MAKAENKTFSWAKQFEEQTKVVCENNKTLSEEYNRGELTEGIVINVVEYTHCQYNDSRMGIVVDENNNAYMMSKGVTEQLDKLLSSVLGADRADNIEGLSIKLNKKKSTKNPTQSYWKMEVLD